MDQIDLFANYFIRSEYFIPYNSKLFVLGIVTIGYNCWFKIIIIIIRINIINSFESF